MDHHVAEQAAGGLDVFGRRWARIAADDGGHFDLADVALAEARREVGEARIESTVEADHQNRLVLLDHLEAGLDALDREAHRLLAEHRLAGVGGGLDQVGMGGSGGGDQNRVHILRFDDVLDRGHLGTDFGGQVSCGFRQGIGQVGDAGFSRSRNGPGMYLADAAGSQNSKSQHVRSSNGSQKFCRFAQLIARLFGVLSCLQRKYGTNILI